MTIINIPYISNSATYFEKFLDCPEAVFLESSKIENSGWDIISAIPKKTYIYSENKTFIINNRTNEKNIIYDENPFLTLKKDFCFSLEKENSYFDDIPFTGGYIGFFSYELLHKNKIKKKKIAIPKMHIGYYDWAILINHQHQKALLFFEDNCQIINKIQEKINNIFSKENKNNLYKKTEKPEKFYNQLENLDTKNILNNHQSFYIESDISCVTSKIEYQKAFEYIQSYLRAGDCYQVNLTQAFQWQYHGNPWYCYLKLRENNPVIFSAYLQYEPYQILSLSPELFLNVNKQQVTTKPIKGTIARNYHSELFDLMQKTKLSQSLKDQAENVMIVDLMRNDLAKVCLAGSVHVEKLFAIESNPSVHHLVSTITAELCPENTIFELLMACFPGGSITGAPKKRVMEIIDELEPIERGVYCGSIGYISSHGKMNMNIAIRTLQFCEGTMTCHAGGGIVVNSQLEQEYQECFDKIAKIKTTIEQLRTKS